MKNFQAFYYLFVYTKRLLYFVKIGLGFVIIWACYRGLVVDKTTMISVTQHKMVLVPNFTVLELKTHFVFLSATKLLSL